jgi:hypothetical protein
VQEWPAEDLYTETVASDGNCQISTFEISPEKSFETS